MTDQTNDHATAAPTAQTMERRRLALLQTPQTPVELAATIACWKMLDQPRNEMNDWAVRTGRRPIG